MSTIDLVLKTEWFDLIKNGIKRSEYRDLTPFYAVRFLERWNGKEWVKLTTDFASYIFNKLNPFGSVERWMYKEGDDLSHRLNCLRFRNFDTIRFRKGYTNIDIKYKVKNIHIGTGKKEWGAIGDTKYFVIDFE